MVHGDIWGFEPEFLGISSPGDAPRSLSLGMFLATRDIDVWGMDRRWVQVPKGTTDLTFMRDWNTGTHVRDLRTALAITRAVRGLTGSGLGKVAMLGVSSGGFLAYAYANEETHHPARARHVDALIIFDIMLKVAPQHEQQRLDACQRYTAIQTLVDSGVYYSDDGIRLGTIGALAAGSPDELSPFVAGLTNRQVALLTGAATYLSFTPPPVPFYHFTAGTFDAVSVPTGLQFTQERALFSFYQGAAPFQSLTETAEFNAIVCDQIDLPYDDRLGRVKIPILYVGAEGGFGTFGTHTLTLLGSSHVSTLIVQFYPAELRVLDFGHADLWLADNAPELVWEPLHKWLSSTESR